MSLLKLSLSICRSVAAFTEIISRYNNVTLATTYSPYRLVVGFHCVHAALLLELELALFVTDIHQEVRCCSTRPF